MEPASTGPTVLSFADLIFTFERWPGGAPLLPQLAVELEDLFTVRSMIRRFAKVVELLVNGSQSRVEVWKEAHGRRQLRAEETLAIREGEARKVQGLLPRMVELQIVQFTILL